MEHAEPAPFPLAYDPALYRNRPLYAHAIVAVCRKMDVSFSITVH